jgi:Aldo/keto reductase family
MNYRILGKTGLKVSEIGYGAWGIGKSGWIGASDDESIKALHRPIDLGLNFIDTALGYGDGHSERLVGRLVRERPNNLRGNEDPTEERYMACTIRGAGGGNVSCRACHCVYRTKPEKSRLGNDRRAAIPRLVRRMGQSGRLAGGPPKAKGSSN